MHRHLGHPSKEVLQCAIDNTNVAVISLRYNQKSVKESQWACNCRTTLLVRRQVMHACKSQWSDPRQASFIQGQEKSGHTVYKGRNARRTSWILRATTLGFIYTLDVLLSKLQYIQPAICQAYYQMGWSTPTHFFGCHTCLTHDLLQQLCHG